MIITAGKFKGRKIKTIKSDNVRPTSSKIRESVFNIVQLNETGAIFYEGETKVLDLFAGSGIMGLEALSRGASKAIFVEKNPVVAKILKQNLSNLSIFENIAETRLIIGDALKILSNFEKNEFNFIFVDPPYESGLYEPILKKIRKTEILKENGIIVIEHSSGLNIADIAIKFDFNVYKTKIYGDTGITVIA